MMTITQSKEQVLHALEAVRADNPDQADWVDFHRALLVAQWAVEESLPSLVQPVTPERVATRQRAQQPLFTFDDLEVEWPAVHRLASHVGEIAVHSLTDWPAEAPGGILEGTARAWYAGQGPDDPRVAFLVGQALLPFLHRAAEAARPHLSPDAYQRWGDCPVCGGEPDFSTLERESGVRLLFCSRCDAGWRYKRIGCPFCDTEAPRKLAYYPSDDGVYRLYVCDACNGYVKTMDLRETVRPFVLPVERILTAGMDLAAAEAGYQRYTPHVGTPHVGH